MKIVKFLNNVSRCVIKCIDLLLECEFNRYGFNCLNICGYCKDGKVCFIVIGVCNNGCEYGWVGK